ncbi:MULTISPECIES: DeoR/GlpR family DNA-binding transcription regulator [Cellulophaga]|uniref:Transcriptional regulator, DeoR family n=2 Tax=Cellulophaga TaxID=104264 RepID=F0RBW2_CELLC|nr:MULTISPECIES: DeoR/GlpR family DNA-binding transcription regulator [Cellulophaga]ADY28578.1 transcriptional regulator, DeoR family [Cellulophaga lytica DSM 7489]AIM59631.1 DeoR faimly transcriptional regulator [Cellulophaga lytica]APU09490.1 DeoR family transcriptional regulator [Cellulophaga lytica]EWH12933.1 DeoR family transcriptional regulator [Cellulophaga geojensis KL-A]MDO6853881.1 DeoR/GlpR family DNA-binding transcription regulator [Cellulophaga lytica]
MLKEERQQFILNEVRVHNRVLLTDMADLLKVSMDTIRRDIKELHKEKKLKKVHGGAISLGFNNYSFQFNEVYSLEKKSKIAVKCINLLRNGQVLLLTGGTTNMELARMLPTNLSLTCFTPSLPVANQLMSKPNVEVIFIGGKVSKDAQITMGSAAVNMLNSIKVDICFLGTHSIDLDEGLTEFDWEIVQMKKAMMQSSRKVIAPVISEKLNTKQRYKICDIQQIDMLVTELDSTNEKLVEFKNKNIEVL